MINRWGAVYVERCKYGSEVRQRKPAVVTRRGAAVLAFNLQRENILPSEHAKAYQMKLEAIKHQGERKDLTCAQVGHKSDGQKSRDIVAEEAGESKSQIQRFIRLNSLEQPLRDKVDSGELAFTPAIELSYLKPEAQKWLQNALEVTQQTPSLSQAQRIKKESKEGTLSLQGIMEIMSEEKRPLHNSVTLSHDTLKNTSPNPIRQSRWKRSSLNFWTAG